MCCFWTLHLPQGGLGKWFGYWVLSIEESLKGKGGFRFGCTLRRMFQDVAIGLDRKYHNALFMALIFVNSQPRFPGGAPSTYHPQAHGKGTVYPICCHTSQQPPSLLLDYYCLQHALNYLWRLGSVVYNKCVCVIETISEVFIDGGWVSRQDLFHHRETCSSAYNWRSSPDKWRDNLVPPRSLRPVDDLNQLIIRYIYIINVIYIYTHFAA